MVGYMEQAVHRMSVSLSNATTAGMGTNLLSWKRYVAGHWLSGVPSVGKWVRLRRKVAGLTGESTHPRRRRGVSVRGEHC